MGPAPRTTDEETKAAEGDFAGGRPYDCVCWSPCGRLLAAGSADRRAVAVWEVGTGARTSIASGVAGTSTLLWSPCGRYLFAAHPAGGFTLWETEGWTAARWGDGKRRGERGGVGTRTAAGMIP